MRQLTCGVCRAVRLGSGRVATCGSGRSSCTGESSWCLAFYKTHRCWDALKNCPKVFENGSLKRVDRMKSLGRLGESELGHAGHPGENVARMISGASGGRRESVSTEICQLGRGSIISIC